MKTNLQEAIDFFWENREKYREEISNGENPTFISPEYANLPEKILRKLTQEEIDAICGLWTEFLGWDVEMGCAVINFENKRAYYSSIKKYIKEKEKNRKEDIILGDFLAWALKNKWWIRGFESIVRTKNGYGQDGWSFVWATQCGFVTDEDIRKVIPKKTANQWDCWGR
jgi:hypothetical protein